MEDDIRTFLRRRGTSEEVINQMEEQKIDRGVILLMDDAQLANFIPSYGDRIALFSFCSGHSKSARVKQGLFEKLREKLKLRKEDSAGEDMPGTSHGNPKRKKTNRGKSSMRMVEIGWIHTENNITKQVRAKQGGGTRKVSMNLQAGHREILEQGKSLFFPGGQSSKGNEADFECHVWDFQQNPLPNDISIETIYSTVRLPILRFYLATQQKHVPSNEQSSTDVTHAITQQTQSNPATEIVNTANIIPDPDIVFGAQETVAASGDDTLSDTLPYDFPESPSPLLPYDLPESPSPLLPNDLPESPSPLLPNNLPESPSPLLPNNLPESPSPLLPNNLPESPSPLLPDKLITLHFSDCFGELIAAFKDPDILNKSLTFRRLLPDNTEEKGCGSGVHRDVYTSFWTEFYERCTLGTTVKVPFLRHDFTACTWKAIGRIFVKGFQDCQYMPIKLAAPFVEETLFGELHTNLKTSFLQYVSCQEQDVLRHALEDFSSVDQDDILELLNTYECRKRANAATLPTIIEEICHKEFIQKPMFVIDCWREITQTRMNLKHEDLAKIYSDLKPTTKKVVGVLHFPSGMTQKQAEVSHHLCRYIRELNEDKLGRFLRFCTGSDILMPGQIKVEFAVQTDFERRPVGHTCGMVLELSDGYDHFPEFRSEFNCVLESNVWIMDIV